MDIGLAEGVAAVSHRVLEGVRLVVGGHLDLPFRMLLHQRGHHRLVVQRGIGAPIRQLRNDQCPVLVALELDTRDALQPLGVVGAEQCADRIALQVGKLVEVVRIAGRHHQRLGVVVVGEAEIHHLRAVLGVVDRITDDIEPPIEQPGNQTVKGPDLHRDLVDVQHLAGQGEEAGVDPRPLVGLVIQERVRPVARRAHHQPLLLDLRQRVVVGVDLDQREIRKILVVHRRRCQRGTRAAGGAGQQRRRPADHARSYQPAPAQRIAVHVDKGFVSHFLLPPVAWSVASARLFTPPPPRRRSDLVWIAGIAESAGCADW